jgi:replicative DNA helicase
MFRRFATLALAFIGTLMPIAGAGALELSGAWATEADLCNQIFSKKGNEVVFAELSDLYGSGFVIDANRIRGKAARCTITSRKQDGENLELAAACATSIMNQNVKFQLKVVDDNNLIRLFPEVPGMSLKYTRCKF